MENLVGRKVKGFRFVGNNYDSDMDDYIGAIGEIKSVDNKFAIVMFIDSECWQYPLSEIQQHLVNEYPKVMTVSDYSDFGLRMTRVVFMEKNGKFLAWSDARTLEDA